MAKTIFDADEPREARPASAYIGMPAPPSQAEEGEPEVVSEPPVERTALNYLAPRKGVDAPGDFRSCASCCHFVPERAFRAATMGNHCALLGSFPVEAHANCNHYAPWPNGRPVEAMIDAHALACLNGSGAALTPYDAGYDSDDDHCHKCCGCRHYDAIGDADTPGPECELMEELNRCLPKIFQVSESVDPNGGCSAWAEPMPDEPNA